MDHSDPPTQAELTREEMEQIHKFLRHAGSHATYQWFTPRNIAIMWNKMKNALQPKPDLTITTME
jgi:phage-related protein